MQREFQKIMDNLLAKSRNIFVLFGYILIVTKGTKENYLAKVREIQKRFGKFIPNAGKCIVAKEQIE